MTEPPEPGHDQTDDVPDDLPEQMQVRRGKRAALLAVGRSAYDVTVPRTHTLAQVRSEFAALEIDERSGVVVTVFGRVIFIRTTGKLCFARLRDGDGAELQAMLSLAEVGTEALAQFKDFVDLGDIIAVTGEVISSRRGELSVSAATWSMVSKALRPLPIEHKPMSDETRVRSRHLDLIVRPEARTMLRRRAAITASVRRTLDSHGYIEVETPVLQTIHGGAAKPFVTHFHAIDATTYLRTNLELALKRLLVGGVHKVYELGRVFRNEGIDSTHSAEFTEIEAYEAFGNLQTMADLIRAMVLDAADVTNGRIVPDDHGGEIDLDAPWRWLPIHQAVAEAVGADVTVDTEVAALRELAAAAEVEVPAGASAGEIVLELFEKLVEHTLMQPTFVHDYPVDVRPLARPNPREPRLAEAFDLIIGGVEIAPAYSELADPVVQRRNFEEQARLAAAGDAEAMPLDEEFLAAIEYGMPPAGGMGMGIDRLVMLLTGARSLRETILFPAIRPARPGS
jgi:lysyl-tRNA synthetase class 2